MQNKPNKKIILNLIRIAQGATSEDVRSNAVNKLWDIYGQQVLGLSGSHSYKADADWDLRGLSPAERRTEIATSTFLMFRQAVLNYDTSSKVPFMAYVAMSSKFHQKSEKRENAKRTNREILVDFSGNTRKEAYGDDPQMIRDLAILNETNSTTCKKIEEVELRDTIEAIERFIKKNNPKLLPYFRTSYEFCQAYGDCKDIDVADELGCTRANVGILRKKLEKLLRDSGFYGDCRLAFAA